MNRMDEIRSFCTSDSITLYWDKPGRTSGSYGYQVFLNGCPVVKTRKTHCTLTELAAGTKYLIRIAVCKQDGELLAESENLTLTTGLPKTMIDVSKSPYLAVGDGKTMNTIALQQAIDACGAGEAVYLPAGIFLTGALQLHSDMELYLEQGAVLQGTEEEEDYLPRIKSRFEGTEMECFSSLLNIGELTPSIHDEAQGEYSCRNVIIRGSGTIASGGRKLAETIISNERVRLKDYLEALGDGIKECENLDTIPGRVRPRLINISNAQNILLSGLTLKNGASWNVHIIYSDSIVTHDCEFYSENVWNGDGWDPDSSTNCTIFGCTFYTGDDAIAIKSGKNPEGNVINRPCEHIRIFDCKSAFGHGIAIGSEISGGINDVKIWDCDMGSSASGIEIKATKKRGGYVKNIHVRDCVVPRIMFHSVGYNDDGIGAGTPPVFENCSFKGLHIQGEYLDAKKQWHSCEAIELSGFDEPEYYLNNITFQDVYIKNKGNAGKQMISLQYCQNISFQNISSYEEYFM